MIRKIIRKIRGRKIKNIKSKRKIEEEKMGEKLWEGKIGEKRGEEKRFVCPKCSSSLVHENYMTIEGVLNLWHCFVCGYISDIVAERNRINPPKPPERRGRKPDIMKMIRDAERKAR